MANRVLAAFVALFAGSWVVLISSPAPVAEAASADVFDTFDVVATLDGEGYVHVTETIVLRFGSSSGRHGLERTFITREPDGEEHDVLYPVDQVAVTSPSGVSTELDLSDQGGGRDRQLRVRVGSADEIVSRATATYVLSYRIGGLVRASGGYDELYWDVSGSRMPLIGKASVKIAVPGGAKEVFCSVARPPGRSDCAESAVSEDEVAEFSAADVATGKVMTVGVKIAPGLITQNTPIRVESAKLEQARWRSWISGAMGAVAAMVPFVGWGYARWRTHDFRWTGLPPGAFPAKGELAREGRSQRVELPVRFEPPQLGVAEAGLLLSGQTKVRHTTAVLVSLAVAGAVQLRGGKQPQVRLVNSSRARGAVNEEFIHKLFPSGKPGRVVSLGESGKLFSEHRAVRDRVLKLAKAGGWYARMPVPSGGNGLAVLVTVAVFSVVTAILGLAFLDSLLPAVLLVSLATTFWLARVRLRRGQRSAKGRALTDQVEGFRKYLATAEAEQLRFEEGEDIFSRYLPWAVVFDLTERWTQVCQRLVEMGRLSEVAPAWSYGATSWSLDSFSTQFSSFDHSVGSSVASSVSSGSSFGESGYSSSSSSFDSGGGFSGGGGGGGGGGSW